MKTKKLIVFISILAAIIFVGIFTNNVKAAGPGYLTIIKERTVDFQTTDVTYKHQTHKGEYNQTENIWNIVTCTGEGVVTDTIPDLYCLRAGLGFTTQNQEEHRVDGLTSPFQRVEYTQDLDMVTGYESIQSLLGSSATTIFKEEQKTQYYELLWVLDHMLLEDATEDELIQYLKDYAEYPEEDFTRENAVSGEFLTRADIEAIQQLAIWYFTNHDEEIHNKKDLTTIYVDISNKITHLGDSNGEYQSYSDLFDNLGTQGTKRQAAAAKLYKNLIDRAEAAVAANSNTYTPVRQLTVYLAGANAAEQQPVVRIEETNKEVDLALRKFISAVNGTPNKTREPEVNTKSLNKEVQVGTESKYQTTAEYNHTKEPLKVQIGDIVTYTLRIYNEGELPAYVTQVTDYLPTYLEYIKYGEDTNGVFWALNDTARIATTTSECEIVGASTNIAENAVGKKLSEVLIPAAVKNEETDDYTLSYVDIQISCKVIPSIVHETNITNIAQITEMKYQNGTKVESDRDSTPNGKFTLPTDPNLPTYKDNEKDKSYIPGQEDDDDFEKVLVVPKFDLALRKFITRVGTTNVNNRYPNVVYENGSLKYEHTKDALGVATGDTVIYTIRVYNEGEADGYAEEITDDVPEGLEFLPDNETNKEYRWVMLDENQEEITDVSKAKYLITDYLSEEQGEASERDNLIKAFNKDAEIADKNPDYRDVQIAFKVTYTATTKDETERTLVNTAQISKDSGDDEDSKPNRDEVYNKDGEKEDDIDYEQVKVKYFDLSLLKWVAQTKVTLNGKTTTTNTGHTAETSKNEAPVKIEIKASDVKKVKIQYVYTIRVTNEGEIEGYAKEVTDYIPNGLKFVKEDNPNWYEISDGVIGTKALENTLLKPGESAEVQVVLTWINGQENFGEKINLAEISKDENPSGSPDVDSTPNNQKTGEDDIDDAPVILAVKTGQTKIYAGLTMIILVILAGGISLIKKYVLE